MLTTHVEYMQECFYNFNVDPARLFNLDYTSISACIYYNGGVRKRSVVPSGVRFYSKVSAFNSNLSCVSLLRCISTACDSVLTQCIFKGKQKLYRVRTFSDRRQSKVCGENLIPTVAFFRFVPVQLRNRNQIILLRCNLFFHIAH